MSAAPPTPSVPAFAGLLAACVLVACGELPARKPVADDAALRQRLGFIASGRVERALVEARLGEPANRYEGGRVVSYPLYLSREGRLQSRPPGDCFALVIEYGQDAVIARHALVRGGSTSCPK